MFVTLGDQTLNAADDSAPDAKACKALGAILDRVGDKWTVLVVGALADGPMRFNALQRTTQGVSHRMLTLTLRGLERDGLVKRTAFPTVPPRVDYELTELGQSLTAPLKALARWASTNRDSVEASREAYDARGGR